MWIGTRLAGATASSSSLSLLSSPFWCLLPKGEKEWDERGVTFFFVAMEVQELLQHVLYPFRELVC
jgi:hypothetical protein